MTHKTCWPVLWGGAASRRAEESVKNRQYERNAARLRGRWAVSTGFPKIVGSQGGSCSASQHTADCSTPVAAQHEVA